jgi:hypothetical protein
MTPIVVTCSCGIVHELTHPVYLYKLRHNDLFCQCGKLLQEDKDGTDGKNTC